jgi:hypothetical protein
VTGPEDRKTDQWKVFGERIDGSLTRATSWLQKRSKRQRDDLPFVDLATGCRMHRLQC